MSMRRSSVGRVELKRYPSNDDNAGHGRLNPSMRTLPATWLFCALVLLCASAAGEEPSSQTASGIAGVKPLKSFSRNNAAVSMLAFSPDGKTLASSHHDGKIELWNITEQQPTEQSLHGHRRIATSVAFSPDGNTLVSAGIDRKVNIWDVAAGRVLVELPRHPGIVHTIAINPKTGALATVSGGKHVMVWDLADPKKPSLAFDEQADSAYLVAWSTDGKWLASASGDNSANIGLWDMEARKALPDRLSHPGLVHALAFNPRQPMLAAAGWESVTLWDTSSLKLTVELKHPRKQSILCIAFSPDGTVLATGDRGGALTLWDVAKRALLADVPSEHEDEVWSVAFAPDGKTLASAGKDGKIVLWEVASAR
jgi:WD40 repeat protein